MHPKGASTYPLCAMGDEQFELMNARLIRLAFPRAFKPAATHDGGADMVLPAHGGGYERCWQSKHYPGRIDWRKCKDSLVAAEKNWKPSHYTFCFPRELTIREQKTFDKHFYSPDAQILIDQWNGEEIQARLAGSSKGQRIARTFFADVELERESVNRAIEVGGRLETTEDALNRIGNVGGFLASKDAYFSYPAVTHEAEGPGPPITPGSVMSVDESNGEVTSRIDVVPRDTEAMERYGPEFILQPADSVQGQAAAARLEEALRHGKPVEIGEGLDLTFTRMPPGLSPLVGQRLTGGTVRLGTPERVHPAIPPWHARLRAITDRGSKASIDVVLRPTDIVPDEWDGALVGHRGALTVTALFRKRGELGALRWNFRYARDSSPVRETLTTLNFFKILSEAGELTISDRGPSGRPDVRIPTPAGNLPAATQALLALLEDVRVIEDWADVEYTLPETITGHDASVVATIANLIRNCGRSVRWRSMEMTVPESNAELLRKGGVLRVEQQLATNLFGHVVQLGHTQLDLANYALVSAVPSPDQAGHRIVRIESESKDGKEIFERLVKRPTPARQPPPSPPRRRAKHNGKRRKKRKR